VERYQLEEREDMNLLKEYIRLIIKEQLEEDIDIQKLSPAMIGVYSLAQAMNRLIYEGGALPGAIPIDIIDAGQKLQSAPMATDTERKAGVSFQSDRNSFKLYLNPNLKKPEMIGNDETHDLIHAFTGHLAKKFGKRKQSIEKSGQYTTTPTEFNRTRLDKDAIKLYNDAFLRAFKFNPPQEVFTKPFNMGQADYIKWFMDIFADKKEKNVSSKFDFDIKNLGKDTYWAVLGDDFSPGRLSKRYYVGYEKFKKPFNFVDYSQADVPFRAPLPPIKYNQSFEDEEELGVTMIAEISKYVTKGKIISNPAKMAKKIRTEYSKSLGLTNIDPDDFKHRYDTAEVENTMKRLFELYNVFVDRYKKAQSNPAARTV
jgi:hypothetical protein